MTDCSSGDVVSPQIQGPLILPPTTSWRHQRRLRSDCRPQRLGLHLSWAWPLNSWWPQTTPWPRIQPWPLTSRSGWWLRGLLSVLQVFRTWTLSPPRLLLPPLVQPPWRPTALREPRLRVTLRTSPTSTTCWAASHVSKTSDFDSIQQISKDPVKGTLKLSQVQRSIAN